MDTRWLDRKANLILVVGALALIVGLVGGCPGAVDPVGQIPQWVLDACPSLNDAEIRTLVSAHDADLRTGTPKSALIVAFTNACDGLDDPLGCVVCNTAAIDYAEQVGQ